MTRGRTTDSDWFANDAEDSDEVAFTEYDITATPNDFNVKTIYDFIASGSVKIPGFQRNFVWDIGRSSKLIESLIMGLPIPQIFLYEEAKNRFLVIDGQQRLMSIYYFIKMRFPKKERRVDLRKIFDEEGDIPGEVLFDDKFFTPFNLKLPERLPRNPSPLSGLNYSTLGDRKTDFDLRPIRNIIIKQNSPDNDDSSIYEIFNRLNTGGVNLKPQEVRASLYHSNFYNMLMRVNLRPNWRALLNLPEPDLHMKDIEILLRGFSVLVEGDVNYKPSMTKFLNGFSKRARAMREEKVHRLEEIFDSFLDSCRRLDKKAFLLRGKFSISIYEAVFNAVCSGAWRDSSKACDVIDPVRLDQLKDDMEFLSATQSSTTETENVRLRSKRAREILLSGS